MKCHDTLQNFHRFWTEMFLCLFIIHEKPPVLTLPCGGISNLFSNLTFTLTKIKVNFCNIVLLISACFFVCVCAARND